MEEKKYLDLQKGSISAAGAYIRINGLYLFAVGAQPHNGRTPVYRLGGHLEALETGWECAEREVQEETGLQIEPITPTQTYMLPDGDQVAGKLEIIQWKQETEKKQTPILVVAYYRYGELLLSLMYLAKTDQFPTPTSEVKGLIFLDKEELQKLCKEAITLEHFLNNGGKAIIGHEIDKSLVLEPFTQPRMLSRILQADELSKF